MQERFEKHGRVFVAAIEADDDGSRKPWDDDGHGPVEIRRNNVARECPKRPGERVIYNSGFETAFYDFAAACKLALANGWGHKGLGAAEHIKDGMSPKAAAAAAVEEDFARMKDWANDEWRYVGVVVTMLDEDNQTPRPLYRESLWGIESDSGEYLQEVAEELADEILVRIGDLEPKGAGDDDGRDFTAPYEP